MYRNFAREEEQTCGMYFKSHNVSGPFISEKRLGQAFSAIYTGKRVMDLKDKRLQF